MKRPVFVLLLGVAACVVAFAACYHVRTAPMRQLMNQPQPELAWLKQEFGLSDAEFSRVLDLHQAYLPRCAERCVAIEKQNKRLQQLLAASDPITSEVEAVIYERARMRADCEAEMLRHFIQVSHTMRPEQGRRYLAWVEGETFLRAGDMERRHQAGTSSTSVHQH